MDAVAQLNAALSDRYTIEREIGAGGMATVYLARDLRHGRAVAIKVLRPELAHAVGAERFLREINIAAQLQSPHIVPLLESGEAGGLLFYVMPYVEGDSLRGLLVKRGALAASEALRLLRDVVDALAHAHRHHVVHRDIKPDNVLIVERHALVADFGVAKAMTDATAGADLTSIGVSLGTPVYMAPEQAAADRDVDHRADIYSIGVLAYEMLAGRPPFVGRTQAVMAAQIAALPEPLQQVRPDVPAAITAIVMKCLEKDPADRFQTADALLSAMESLLTPTGVLSGAAPARPRRAVRSVLAAATLLALVTATYFYSERTRRNHWVLGTALPELRRFIEAAEPDSAFELALRIQTVAPRNEILESLWPAFSRKVVLTTDPEGVRVYRASMPDTARWHFVGTTPTDSVRLPTRVGMFRYEKPGYRTVRTLFVSPARLVLDPVDAPFPEMVWIPGGTVRAFLVGTDAAPPVTIGPYRMDRFEVTNGEYRTFVDAGGYAEPSFWEHPFHTGERTLTFEEAVARFVDRTGRPGPATWEGGTFPSGQGDLPVGGVSWYEAAAYAKYAGKSLPTIYHWARAANIAYARFIVPLSNLDSDGARPVGTLRGISLGGVSDLAGNVREWCLNDAGDGQRFILGGGWSDPRYAFVDAYAQHPMDRAVINGIRLVRYGPDDAGLAETSAPIPRAFTDYTREQPVSDAVFAGFTSLFDYDAGPLDARVEVRDSTPEAWVVERATFNAAYGGERMAAWIFLPKQGTPPYQTVVLFPGSGVIGAAPSGSTPDPRISFLPPSGRAAVLPILKSTFERSDSLRSDIPDPSIFWRDHVVMWVKDFRRTLDYLSTRADIDSARFAYFGFSWGGYMGGIIPAVEPRLKASILYVAGFTMERSRPEVDPLHFLPRIRTPVLMLNGEHDYFFPAKTAQEPFYALIGTPEPHKRYTVYEGGHDVPRTQLIRESLAWLDTYFGPVRRMP